MHVSQFVRNKYVFRCIYTHEYIHTYCIHTYTLFSYFCSIYTSGNQCNDHEHFCLCKLAHRADLRQRKVRECIHFGVPCINCSESLMLKEVTGKYKDRWICTWETSRNVHVDDAWHVISSQCTSTWHSVNWSFERTWCGLALRYFSRFSSHRHWGPMNEGQYMIMAWISNSCIKQSAMPCTSSLVCVRFELGSHTHIPPRHHPPSQAALWPWRATCCSWAAAWPCSRYMETWAAWCGCFWVRCCTQELLWPSLRVASPENPGKTCRYICLRHGVIQYAATKHSRSLCVTVGSGRCHMLRQQIGMDVMRMDTYWVFKRSQTDKTVGALLQDCWGIAANTKPKKSDDFSARGKYWRPCEPETADEMQSCCNLPYRVNLGPPEMQKRPPQTGLKMMNRDTEEDMNQHVQFGHQPGVPGGFPSIALTLLYVCGV